MDNWLENAKKLLGEVRGQTLSLAERQGHAIELARLLLTGSAGERTWRDRGRDLLMGKVLASERAKQIAVALSDQSFRSQNKARTQEQIKFLVGYRVPGLLPFLKKMMATVILPGERAPLTREIKRRTERGVRVNLNRLGEAILGEGEAERRAALYLEDLAQEEIDYISIKISTLYSQLNPLAWEETLDHLAQRIRPLYRQAMERPLHKMVNLDMEAYTDLQLTVALFQRVLDEPEFLPLRAGIVLQAYLPESFAVQRHLTAWAADRVGRGGAPIKIRVVKGANLGMEHVEASLHDWPAAPFESKAEVDANFKRMVTFGCEPAHSRVCNIGIASHNLFDIAYALVLRSERKVENHIVFEMLEGMAPPQQRALHALVGDTLLYCPTSRKKEFAHAMAYLIRRLDENTAPENFLRHIADLKADSDAWNLEAERFKRACEGMSTLPTAPRRTQNRLAEPKDLPPDAPFANEAPTDFSLEQNRDWAAQLLPLPPIVKPTNLPWEEIDTLLDQGEGAPFPQVAPLFRRHRAELIQLMMAEGKKTVAEADPEVCEAIDFLEYYPRSAAKLHADPEVSWKPRGSIVVTPPWNFPLAIPTGGIAAALAAGNAVFFKPAPEASAIGRKIAELFWEAGVPKSALHFIPCDEEPTGNKLIADPRVNGVILTGATATAQHFLSLRPDLPLFAETGGKNSLILSNMADRDLAISDLIHSAFGHSGQKCSACSIAILHKELYDDPKFLRGLKDAAESLPVGPQTHFATRVGPLIHPAREPLLGALTTLAEGEEWLLQPKKQAEDLWSPGIKLAKTLNPTEFFGPVLTLLRAENLDHALELANSTPYGLTTGLHTLDSREIDHWRTRIEAGNLYVNRGITGAICGRQPFGGCKASSFGPGAKAGGPAYVAQLMLPTQKQLPSFDARHPVEALLPEGDIPTFRASLGSYLHHWEKLKQPTELAHLIGESNQLYRVPRDHVTLLSNDKPLDIASALCAAQICGTPVSLDGTDPTPWRAHFTLVDKPARTHLCELPCLASGQYELLRYTREVSLSTTTHRYGNL